MMMTKQQKEDRDAVGVAPNHCFVPVIYISPIPPLDYLQIDSQGRDVAQTTPNIV